MVLSDRKLKELIKSGELGVSPMDDSQIQPGSIDIRLGDSFSALKNCNNSIIKMGEPVEYQEFTCKTFLLLPGHFVLSTTVEYIRLPDYLTAFVEGRSSIGRMGLFVQNAGWVDAGFEGEITLELFNASSMAIELNAGRRIGQLVFAQLDGTAENPYRGKYQRQRKATGSRIHLDGDY